MADTLDQFIGGVTETKSDLTKKTYYNALSQFEKWLIGSGTDLEGFARSDVQQYIDYLTAKKKSAATINKNFNAIKSYCRWIGKRDLVEGIRVIKQPNIMNQAPKALSNIERNKLIREVDRSGNARNFAIVMTLLYTGIRLSELVALDKADIELGERKGSLKVRSGKGNKERTIPLNAEARRAISIYLEQRNDTLDCLFLSNRQERISNRTVQHLVEQYGYNVHALRHTYITALVRAGEDIGVVQSLSGHNSADMILRYSKPTEEDKQKAVDRIYLGG